MKTFSEFNEGVLDFLSKDKREKRKKVKARAQNISNIRKSKEQEIQKMKRMTILKESVLLTKKKIQEKETNDRGNEQVG